MRLTFKKHYILFFILFISWAGALFIKAESRHTATLQEGIASEIIRFHVIANSDSKEDQDLKYKVKEALVEELSPILSKTSDITEGRSLIKSKFSSIQTLAEKVISQNGYNYAVSVSLEFVYFPMKVYGEFTFPPGIYEALNVRIGEAKGQNWWCIMFPPLCFVDETYSIVNPDSEEQLELLLTEEEYEAIKSKKVPVKYKFKLWKTIKKLFS